MLLDSATPTISEPFSPSVVKTLKSLEKNRLLAANRLKFGILVAILGIIPFAIGIIIDADWLITVSICWLIFLAVGFIILLQFFIPSLEEVSNQYKKIMVPQLLRVCGIQGDYHTSHRLTIDEFLKSGLYRENYSHVERYDHIIGKFKEIPFVLYELAVQIADTYHTEDGMSHRSFTNHFYGWVLHVPIPPVAGKTYIIPKKRKTEHESDDWTSAVAKYLLTKYKPVSLKNIDPDFDVRYVVFSTLPAEAEQLLRQPICQFLSQVEQASNNTTAFSFFENRAYMHVGINGSSLDLNSGDRAYPINSDRHIKQLRFFSALVVGLFAAAKEK